MQLVKDVIEQLGRFNPEAVMTEELTFNSASPATSCSPEITGGDMADKVADAEQALKNALVTLREIHKLSDEE